MGWETFKIAAESIECEREAFWDICLCRGGIPALILKNPSQTSGLMNTINRKVKIPWAPFGRDPGKVNG